MAANAAFESDSSLDQSIVHEAIVTDVMTTLQDAVLHEVKYNTVMNRRHRFRSDFSLNLPSFSVFPCIWDMRRVPPCSVNVSGISKLLELEQNHVPRYPYLVAIP